MRDEYRDLDERRESTFREAGGDYMLDEPDDYPEDGYPRRSAFGLMLLEAEWKAAEKALGARIYDDVEW